MSDITMCVGTGCPLRDACYRFVAAPSVHAQSYFLTPPVETDGSCKYRWPLATPEPVRKPRIRK